MLRNSFVFLERVGARKEQSFWKQGIQHWTDFLAVDKIKGISPQKKHYYNRQIQEAQKAFFEERLSYFVGKLPAREMWRLYEEFKETCCFLDVEIDSSGNIVVVGISQYYHSNFFVRYVNLDKDLLQRELQKYKIIITFNGASFDLPLLRKQLGCSLHQPHIDLRPLCHRIGLYGGLKEIEQQLQLKRPSHLYGNPVNLWRAFHASGDKEYLDLLIDYNREDIENLKLIMEHVYMKLKTQMLEWF